MEERATVYEKLNSFAGIRQRQPVPDPLPRVRKVYEALPSLSLPTTRTEVVRQACEELLGTAPPADYPPFTVHPNVAEEIARLTDEELPRYLFYRYRYEIFPVRRLVDDFPPCVQIEPTSVCNYRCVFCYQIDGNLSSKRSGEMGFMPLALFKGLIDQCEGRCEAITLASRGEPMLCSDIENMLRYASGKFLALKLNTNASRLDEAKCHAILQADVSTLVFSVDAATEPLYSQLRVGGKLDRVMSNIRLFHDIRAKHYPDSRVITRVSGVEVPGTPGLEEMMAVWGDLVDQVAFVRYNPWQNTYERDVNDIVDPCTALWFRMFVWWDGKANPCDNDYLSHLSVGNVHETDLADLWRSEKFEELRERHASKQRRQCFPCDRCPVV